MSLERLSDASLVDMSMPHQSAVMPSRDFLKCDQCRKEHKKCIPRNREWGKRHQQKCDRCDRLGHACGPLERKPKTVQQDRVPYPESQRAVRSQPAVPCSVTRNNGTAARLARPLEPYAIGGSASAASMLLFLIPTYELILSCKINLRRLRQSCMLTEPMYSHRRNILDAFTMRMQSRFEAANRLAEAQPQGRRSADHEPLYWKVTSLNVRYGYLSCIDVMSEATGFQLEQGRWLEMPTSQDNDDARVLTCTANILNTSRRNSLQPGLGDYSTLERQIEDLMRTSQHAQTHTASPLNPGVSSILEHTAWSFPATHIAYLNNDKDTAFELWRQSPTVDFDAVDILGRTFLHLLIESGDEEMTKRIASHDANAISSAGCDKLGLSPLDFATGSNNWELRDLLHHHRARSYRHLMPSLSDVAQRATDEGYTDFGRNIRDTQHHPNMTGAQAVMDLDVPPDALIAQAQNTLWGFNTRSGGGYAYSMDPWQQPI